MIDLPNRYGVVIDDQAMSDEDLRKYLVFVDSNKLVIDWHSPFRGFVIVITENEISEINDSIGNYFGNTVKFLIFDMPGGGGRGTFAEQTWDWLKRSRQDAKNYLESRNAQTH